LMPEPFDRVVTDAVFQFIIDDPHEFPIRKPVVKAFESLELLHHGVGHPGTGPFGGRFFCISLCYKVLL
jgi:hypothetical protein